MSGELISRAFRTEHKPLLEKRQASMGTADLFSAKHALLENAAAAVQARRALNRLIELGSQPG